MISPSELIYNALANNTIEHRAYIGASSIGNPCERAIWYSLNRPESKVVEPKTLLTFEIGRKLESLLISLLGHNCLLHFPYVFVSKEYPKFQGTCDGEILNDDLDPIALIEIKTAKNSSFNTFKSKGLRLWMPEYYDQVQSYMGMSGIHKCYLIAINKDSSELHDEMVDYDDVRYKWLVEKAKRIGDAITKPPRINNSPSYWKCKICFYKGICHE